MNPFTRLKEEYPAGTVVFQKATKTPGVVCGWVLSGGGEVLLHVDYGEDIGRLVENDFCMTAIKSQEDGDEWKDGGLEKL